MDQESKSALDVLALTARALVSQLQGINNANANSEIDLSEFDQAEFAKQLDALADTISHECTKFSMVFTDGAVPNAKTTESLSNRLIGMAAALVKITISCGGGMNFRRSIMEAAADLFRSIAELANAAKEGAANTKAQLKETGTVWELCDRLKALPKSPRDLLLWTMTSSLNMVNDALSEIQELNEASASSSNDDDEYRSWTEKEKLRLGASSQLVKAAKAVISKTRVVIEQANVDWKSTVIDDDELTTLVNRISPQVDNVVSLFHEDTLDSKALNSEVSRLYDDVLAVLSTFKKTMYYQDESHKKWFDILCTGIQHNVTKYRNSDEHASQ